MQILPYIYGNTFIRNILMTRLFNILIAFLMLLSFPMLLPAQEPDAEPEAPAVKEADQKEKKEEVTDISDQEVERKLEIFAKVLDLVSEKYVNEVDRGKLIEGAIRGMMMELDPYSTFMSLDVMTEMRMDLKGEFEGIGVYIILDENNILTVLTPIEGMPAWKEGMMAGDKILEINGESTQNLSLHDAVKKIRGKKGTKVTLTVYHTELREKEEITITRERIPVPSVTEKKMADADGGIGYIRLNNFQRTSAEEMLDALKELSDQGMKALVIDLRDNGGGLLQSAIQISDLFLDSGIIVSVKGRGGIEPYPPATAKENSAFEKLPIAVLVNGYSASASEILSAALRDNHRAVLVGEKTYGKGSVQELIQLEDGSGIKLTIQKYYTPSGISIDKTGIKPDIEEKMTIETKMGILKQRREAMIEKNRKEKDDAEGAEDPAAVKPEEKKENGKVYIDTQLQRAVDILKGIEIFRARLMPESAE